MATTQSVKLFIYDISKGLATQLGPMLIGRPLEGIWHTSIVAYGQEYFFGSMGIESCPPCGTILGSPDKQIDLGNTEVPSEIFIEYLAELGADAFKPAKYELFDHNCNHFTAEVSQFLTGKKIPDYITNLPGEVLSTPMGQMLKSVMENMKVHPSAGFNSRRY